MYEVSSRLYERIFTRYDKTQNIFYRLSYPYFQQIGLFLIVFIPEAVFTLIIILNVNIFSRHDKNIVPRDCSPNEDQVYYQQLALPLLHSFHNTMKIGELGSVECGSFFLCRHEDRIMWIQVGKDFIIYSNVIASTNLVMLMVS